MTKQKPPEVTHEDIERIAHHLVNPLSDHLDKEDLFQEAFLEGLEAREKGVNVFGAMRAKVSHSVAFSGSPMEVPASSGNHSALAKLKRGEPATTTTEKRIAAVLSKREDILPITVVTTDTPESLLVEKQLMERLEPALRFYLTEKQEDAIGVVFYGEPSQEEFMLKHEVGYEGIRWHSNAALEKLKLCINGKEN